MASQSADVNISKDGGDLLLSRLEVLWIASETRVIGILGGEGCWLPPPLLFCSWEEDLAEEIPLVARSRTLSLRVPGTRVLRSDTQRTTEASLSRKCSCSTASV